MGDLTIQSSDRPIEQTVRALDALRKEGKTKYIGLSEVRIF